MIFFFHYFHCQVKCDFCIDLLELENFIKLLNSFVDIKQIDGIAFCNFQGKSKFMIWNLTRLMMHEICINA